MRITKISLTNFRSFKETQIIDLAPITLLFGPNSVGKSSVLMALAYVQQILEKGHCDPQKLDALGDKTIGGFRSLVYGGDLKQAIRIHLGFELGNTIYPSDDEDYVHLADIFNTEGIALPDFGGSVEHFAFELEIAWSEKMEWTFVRNYRVWVNDVYMGRIHSSDDLKNSRIVDLNAHHPLALTEQDQEAVIEGVTLKELSLDSDDEEDDSTLHFIPTELEQVLDDLVPGKAGVHHNPEEKLPDGCLSRSRPIGIQCQWGAIPEYSEYLRTNLKCSDLEPTRDHLIFLIVRSFLHSTFLEPINLARRFLKSYVAIGPMRVVPDFDYVPDPNPEQSGWADGRAAWDLLYQNPGSNDSAKRLLSRSNCWLSDEDKLNTGYTISNWSLLERLEGGKLYENTHYLAKKRHLLFLEKGSELALSASQLGTGISQVLPVLVAAHCEKLELVSVEQPELHLHPKFQVSLGDLFIECSNDRGFLIETHSEHLILRMLRRVREGKLAVDDVSVCYLKATDGDGVVVERQQITNDGDFEMDWPDGFFDERDKELF